jgi:hypothetical protein
MPEVFPVRTTKRNATCFAPYFGPLVILGSIGDPAGLARKIAPEWNTLLPRHPGKHLFHIRMAK